MNNVCKEHEWVDVPITLGGVITGNAVTCSKCGRLNRMITSNTPIDFKIEDNLKVIEGNKWDDVFKEFAKVDFFDKIKQYEMYDAFADWIEENYNAPEKKI